MSTSSGPDSRIIEAAMKGDAEEIKLLIQARADANAIQPHGGRTILQFAVDNGHASIVKLLIDAKAKIKTRDCHGTAALHIAVDKGDVDIIKRLIDAEANVNAANYMGTSLHHAVQKGKANIVKMLIDANSDLNELDFQSRTALHIAVDRREADIFEMLMDARADVNQAAKNGRSPLMLSVESEQDNEQAKIFKWLLDAKADVNAADEAGTTAVMKAAGGKMILLKMLIDAKADVNAQDKGGRMALHYAERDAACKEKPLEAMHPPGGEYFDFVYQDSWPAFVFGALSTMAPCTILLGLAWVMAEWGLPEFMMQFLLVILGSVQCELGPKQTLLVIGLWTLDFVNTYVKGDAAFGIVLVMVVGVSMWLLKTKKKRGLLQDANHSSQASAHAQDSSNGNFEKVMEDVEELVWSSLHGVLGTTVMVSTAFGPVGCLVGGVLSVLGLLLLKWYVKKKLREASERFCENIERIKEEAEKLAAELNDAPEFKKAKLRLLAKEKKAEADQYVESFARMTWKFLKMILEEIPYKMVIAGAVAGLLTMMAFAIAIRDSGLLFVPEDAGRAKAIATMQAVFFLKPLIMLSGVDNVAGDAILLLFTLIPLILYLSALHERSSLVLHLELGTLVLCYMFAIWQEASEREVLPE